MELRYAVFDTELGWVGLVASAAGLRRVVMPQGSRSMTVRQCAREGAEEAAGDSAWFGDLAEKMRRYLRGERVAFDDEVDSACATSFLRAVWEATRLIPYGESRSYSWVAEQIGKPRATRAVGQALGRNPVPIVVPCHRVVSKNGGLGGFGGGLDMKKRLLALEGWGGGPG